MRRWNLVGAWLLVLALATAITWQIVSAASGQVSDRPAPLNVGAPVITGAETTTTSSPARTPPTTTETPTTTTLAVGPTTTTMPPEDNAPPSTTTTTSPQTAMSSLVPTAGGVVVVSFVPGEVTFASATPAPGFQVEVENFGPPQVEVEFQSELVTVDVRVRWRDGGLDIEVSQSLGG